MTHTTFNIPVQLGRELLRDKKYIEARLWLAAKAVHGAYVPKEDLDRKAIADLCGVTVQGTYKTFKKLLDLNWIGEDEKCYYFHSIKSLCECYYKVQSRKVFELDIEKDLADLQTVLFDVSVKDVVINRKHGMKFGSSVSSADEVYKIQDYESTTVSESYLSDKLGISENMVHRLKHKAQDLGLMKIISNKRKVSGGEKAYFHEMCPYKMWDYIDDTYINLTDDLYSFARFKKSSRYKSLNIGDQPNVENKVDDSWKREWESFAKKFGEGEVAEEFLTL